MLLREKGKLLSLQIDIMLTTEYQCNYTFKFIFWLHWYKKQTPGGEYVKAIFEKQNQNFLLSYPHC